MGWTFTRGATRAEVVAELIEAHDNRAENGERERFTTLAHRIVGGVLWAVHEIDRNGEVETFIGCYLLENQSGYGWGYKPMEEAMGLFCYSCPLEFLALAPEANASWRAKVRAFHGAAVTA